MRRLGIDVTVRMYKVGFGDAFLIRIPHRGHEYRVLVDCGVHSAGQARDIDEVVGDIIDDCTDDDGCRIDVVVATHRHRDHVQGFADDRWSDVDVGQVWLPWTENPRDKVATRIRETQSSLAARLTLALRANGAAAELQDCALNSLTNQTAMDTLHAGFKSGVKPKFLPTRGAATEPLTIGDFRGARVHVLGPTRDESIIRDMNPPATESYLAMAARSKGDGTSPFHSRWQMDRDDFEATFPNLAISKQLREHLYNSAEGADEAAAVALEDAVNNTSLMLMFEIGNAFLLFPGDAQWGTWQAAIDDPLKRELLEKTTFYKVGHHGSHNATPKRYFEDVLKGEPPASLSAMISVQRVGIWKSIPLPKLLTRLGEMTNGHWVRSDNPGPMPDGFAEASGRHIDVSIPA